MWSSQFWTLFYLDFNKLLTDIPLTDDEKRLLDNGMRGLGLEERQVAEVQFKIDKVSAYGESVDHLMYGVLMEGGLKTRRPFLTEEGFVGIGPAGIQEGGDVYILAGASFPFILRESHKMGGYHEVVGEAFVDGIMDGEALQMGLEIVDLRLV